MFEILMFLFENYMDGNVHLGSKNELVVQELERVGFDRFEIDRALDWLDGLNQVQEMVQINSLRSTSIRHYLAEEAEQIGVEGRGFLIHLEQINILDPITREIVIDRLMALDPREVDLGRIRWVVLMALFTQPEKKAALVLLQNMILADAFDVLH